MACEKYRGDEIELGGGKSIYIYTHTHIAV